MFEHHEGPLLKYSDLECDTSPKGRYYVSPDGKRYPSVTTVLGHRSKGWLQEWRQAVGPEEANRVARHAAARGNAVHSMTERYVNNQDPYAGKSVMPHHKVNFLAIKAKLDAHLGKVYMQECPLYSDHLGLAGRVDCIAMWDGKLSIIDFKTSKRIKKHEDIRDYFIQESAYAIMFEERTGIPITRLVTAMCVDGAKEALVFVEHRDRWTRELIERISEYKSAALFGHV